MNVLGLRPFRECVAMACVTALLVGSRPASAATDAQVDREVAGQSESAPVAPAKEGDGRRTLARLPVNLGRGVVGIFNKDNLVPALVGGAATAGAAFLDDEVRDAASDPNSSFGKGVEKAGDWPLIVAIAGLFTGGRLAHGQRFRAMTYDIANAAIINLGYTELLKVTVQRERPDGSNKLSFPSGHASDAFTWATVLERHYGWKLGVPAYALAASIGYSRIVRDKHYLSDVVAGATLGVIVGRTVVRVNSKALGPGEAKTTLNLSPMVWRDTRGLQLSLAF